jgi:probable rRNA maturation factor
MITIELTNRQRIKRVSFKQLHRYLGKVLRFLNLSSQRVSILLCDDRLIKRLNQKYFGNSSLTDVIAFPLRDSLEPDYLGEVVVSVERAVRVAPKLGRRWQDELKLYLVHGILHLSGYDDRTKAGRLRMEKKQEEIIARVL